MTTPSLSETDLAAIQTAGAKLGEIRREIAKYIYGQDAAIDSTLTALLSGGHMLLVGMPGLAKTRLVSMLSRVLGIDTKRIQCTPDLMPSDIIGAEVLEEVDYGRRNFRFIPGPIFCQFLMVDEINRASPRTQSALLQAMQEHHITVSGREYTLPEPFHVLATQNPIEQEGTYPLPEAQLDRFLIQIDINYPDLQAEKQIVTATAVSDDLPRTIAFVNDLREMQALVRHMPLTAQAIEAIVTLVRSGRPATSNLEIVNQYVSWGPGPRASQALALAMRARALIDGRSIATMDDMLSLVRPVLQHRMALNYAARADGIALGDVLKAMSQTIAAF